MGGIINYYHGESGLVVDRQFVLNEEQRAHILRLQGDPHREFAFAYGGDVYIDPLLRKGDTAVFIRTEQYGGLWVREQDSLYPELQQAHDRVLTEIRKNSTPGLIAVRIQGFWAEQYIAEETRKKTGSSFPERPATEASFFLSFSSQSVLLARQVFEDLKYDTKVEVWFDLDQAGEAPEHRRRIERWLREAVHASRGFILLWTKAAKESSWVNKEISWASEKASRDPDFHFIVLKLDDEPVPVGILDTSHVIECYDLWPVNGINEELFAAVTRRRGRTAWIEQNRRRGIELLGKEDGSLGYEPFVSDSGIAILLRHWEEHEELRWQLDYEKYHRLHKASGCGTEEAVDLGIRPGDEVGFFICHRAALGRFWPGVPMWMRSGDLGIKPEHVLGSYWQRSDPQGNTSADLKTAMIRARRRV